jgi:hypothetical protein
LTNPFVFLTMVLQYYEGIVTKFSLAITQIEKIIISKVVQTENKLAMQPMVLFAGSVVLFAWFSCAHVAHVFVPT